MSDASHSDQYMRENNDGFVVDDGADGQSLFGSGSEAGEAGEKDSQTKKRKLDDSELDSGDDEERHDRIPRDEEGDRLAERTAIITDMSIGRHRGPMPSDGELYLLSFPNTIKISPQAFLLENFEPPVPNFPTDENAAQISSPLDVSNNTIRWRRTPGQSRSIQSNARINRWADGSLTLQFATTSREQFQLSGKALAQPQTNPKRPSPTSISNGAISNNRQNVRLDSHMYLAAPHEHAGVMRHTHHFTTALTVQSSDQDDKALLALEQNLAAATRGNKKVADGGLEVISINEDPENAKRRAELAEKEKSRMLRRLQVHQEREDARANIVLRRSGARGPTGLTIGDLEGTEATPRAISSRSRRKPRRRNSDYSDDDEIRGRGRTKEDEYDEDDGFLVGSDEEIEAEGDGESEEEAEEELNERENGKDNAEPTRGKSGQSAMSGDAEEALGGGIRSKRRRVIDDEEEDGDE